VRRACFRALQKRQPAQGDSTHPQALLPCQHPTSLMYSLYSCSCSSLAMLLSAARPGHLPLAMPFSLILVIFLDSCAHQSMRAKRGPTLTAYHSRQGPAQPTCLRKLPESSGKTDSLCSTFVSCPWQTTKTCARLANLSQ